MSRTTKTIEYINSNDVAWTREGIRNLFGDDANAAALGLVATEPWPQNGTGSFRERDRTPSGGALRLGDNKVDVVP